MTDRRGESEKHFRMNDGSFTAVDYGAPVHFTEDDGETWNALSTIVNNAFNNMYAKAEQPVGAVALSPDKNKTGQSSGVARFAAFMYN